MGPVPIKDMQIPFNPLPPQKWSYLHEDAQSTEIFKNGQILFCSKMRNVLKRIYVCVGQLCDF